MLPAWLPFRLRGRPATSRCVPPKAPREQPGLCGRHPAGTCWHLHRTWKHVAAQAAKLMFLLPAYAVQQQSPRQSCPADGDELQWHCRSLLSFWWCALQMVFSSSCTVYGNPNYTPIDEKHPLHAVSPYGRSKLIIEDMFRDLAASPEGKDWKIILLRYFNPVGAHPSGQHHPHVC